MQPAAGTKEVLRIQGRPIAVVASLKGLSDVQVAAMSSSPDEVQKRVAADVGLSRRAGYPDESIVSATRANIPSAWTNGSTIGLGAMQLDTDSGVATLYTTEGRFFDYLSYSEAFAALPDERQASLLSVIEAPTVAQLSGLYGANASITLEGRHLVAAITPSGNLGGLRISTPLAGGVLQGLPDRLGLGSAHPLNALADTANKELGLDLGSFGWVDATPLHVLAQISTVPMTSAGGAAFNYLLNLPIDPDRFTRGLAESGAARKNALTYLVDLDSAEQVEAFARGRVPDAVRAELEARFGRDESLRPDVRAALTNITNFGVADSTPWGFAAGAELLRIRDLDQQLASAGITYESPMELGLA